MPNPHKGSGGRPGDCRSLDDLLRVTLRGEDLLVPSTADELKRFEDELLATKGDIPPEVLDPLWLFTRGEPAAEPARASAESQPSVECHSVAARDGSAITDRVAAKMREDRAGKATVSGEDVPSERQVGDAFATAARLREIGELAEWIAHEQCPNGMVKPEQIAAKQAMGVSFNDYEDAFDGLLEHQTGKFHIFCNLRRVESQQSDRARFTLAHELGHYFIDAHRARLERGESLPLSQCDFESAQPIEREADHFAAHLLMPSRRFAKQVRGASRGLSTLFVLRKHFGTSLTSTACRYAAVSGVPCAVVKWSPGGHVWRVLSPEAREAGLGRVIDAAALPEGAATTRAIAGEVLPPQGYFQTGSTVADWFRGVLRGNRRNAILVEQAIPLGRFGVLTLLFPEKGGFDQPV